MVASRATIRAAVWLTLVLTSTGCRRDAAPVGAGPNPSAGPPSTPSTETLSAPLSVDANAVWAQVPLRWRLLEIPPPLPVPRDSAGVVALDPVGDGLIVVGGYKKSPENPGLLFGDDIWSLAFEPDPHWTELPVADPKPVGRAGHVIVDPVRNRVNLALGDTWLIPHTKYLSEVWTYELDSPKEFLPVRPLPPTPLPVASSHLAYIPARNAVVFHGGIRDNAVAADTWILELADELPRWRHVASGNVGIGKRAFGFHYYDSKRDMFVVVAGMRCYGGCKVQGPLDAWALTGLSTPGGEEWVQLALDTELPTSAIGSRCAYDPKADRAVCQGLWLYPDWPGSDKTVDLSETWAIASTGPRSLRMRRLDVGGSEPTVNRTDVHYDPKRDRFVFFGGWKKSPGYTATTNDTWVLERRPDLASCTTAAALQEVAP